MGVRVLWEYGMLPWMRWQDGMMRTNTTPMSLICHRLAVKFSFTSKTGGKVGSFYRLVSSRCSELLKHNGR